MTITIWHGASWQSSLKSDKKINRALAWSDRNKAKRSSDGVKENRIDDRKTKDIDKINQKEYKTPIHPSSNVKTHTHQNNTYIPPHIHTSNKKDKPHSSDAIWRNKIYTHTSSYVDKRAKNNISLRLIVTSIIIIASFWLLKTYLDSLTKTLTQEDISEDFIGESFYIAKDSWTNNYNLISTQDQQITQAGPDAETQAWEAILSQLTANTGVNIVLNQTGTKTWLKSPETQLITDLYRWYNTEDKNLIFPILDTRFKNSEEYLTYFRTTRIKKFVNALDGWLQVNNFKVQQSDNPLYKTMVAYQVQYSLNEQIYLEDRSAYLVSDDQSDQNLKIKRLYCTSKNCSKGPFFNFQKFDID